MSKNYHYFSVALLVVFVTFVAGCGGGTGGPQTFRVEGTVTHNGVPVEGAAITFYVTGGAGTPGLARTDASGKYRLQTAYGAIGTTPGEYAVTVDKRVEVATGRRVREEFRNPDTGVMEMQEVDEIVLENRLPVRYASPQTTPFMATVEAKRLNTFDFTLE
jgi:hypothetical protein